MGGNVKTNKAQDISTHALTQYSEARGRGDNPITKEYSDGGVIGSQL
jgi:hypothetical protein